MVLMIMIIMMLCTLSDSLYGAIIDHNWISAMCLGSCSCIDAIEMISPDSCRIISRKISSKKSLKCTGDHSCAQGNKIESKTNNIDILVHLKVIYLFYLFICI
eukprot:196110_1